MTGIKKIMFFSPYAWWLVHSQVDAVVATALRLRNCDVFLVGCDGVYQNCNLAHLATHVGYKYADACQACSQTSKQFFDRSFNLPYLQLRDYITDNDYNLANKWLESIGQQDYKNAVYLDLPIGKWVTSSIYTYFRISSDTELSRPEVRKVHKQYLIDGLITYNAISRLLDTYKPTNLFLFNGRFAPYSVALEAARKREIDIITHERGFISDSFAFFDNSSCLSPKTPLDCVNTWQNIPLTKPEISQVKQYFVGREYGDNLSWPSFYDFNSNHTNIRLKLRIPLDSKIVTVFTSSEDELAMSEDYKLITNQLDMIDNLMEIFKDRDEYLVIRHHPLIGGSGSKTFQSLVAHEFLSRAYQQALSAPENVRIIMPSEQLTSYALLWHTDAAIAFFSTVALEAVARGVSTATFKLSRYRGAIKYAFEDTSKKSLRGLVDKLLSASSKPTVEDLTKLYRFTHAYFFKFSTKLRSIGIKDYHFPDLKVKTSDDLKPGVDPVLDRICNRLIHNSSIYDVPNDERKNNSNFEELNFFNNELIEIEEYRQTINSQTLDSNFLSVKPSVAIIRLNYTNIQQTNNQCLQVWKNQSRHQNLIVYDCNNLDWYDYQGIIGSIIHTISTAEEEYILITNDYIQYDESFISSALDALLTEEQQEIAGVLFGAWIASSSRIDRQIFTERVPAKTYSEAIEILPLLKFPQSLLSFGLIRKDLLLQFLTSVKSISTLDEAAANMFSLFQQQAIHRVELPMLIIQQLDTELTQDVQLKNQSPENCLPSKQLDTNGSFDRNRHILLYTDDPSIYGVGQYNHTVLCGLARLGYKVTCVQSKVSNLLIQERQQLGIQHLWLNYDTHKEFGRTLTSTSDARNIFDALKPDLVIFSDCCPLSNLAAKKVANQMCIPYIIVDGCAAPYLAERFAVFLKELETIHIQARAVITVSTENLNLLHQLFKLPKDKGQVIYHGRPAQYFTPRNLTVRDRLRQEYAIPANAVICFTAARLDAGKGYQHQIAAIKQLMQNESWHNLYFVWAGDGVLEAQLKQAIEQLKISNQVKLLGKCTNIKEWLDASDIFILPSEFESFGLAIVEAMAKGLPVIASAVGGITEVLGDTGKLISDPKIEPQATVEEMATTIQSWSVNPELRHSIGMAGKKRAEKMFREERMIEQTVEVVECTLSPLRNQVSSSGANMPLVSVIISCYNLAQFLPETVASVIAQTYENWEIIIVNDGSTDNTSEVAQKLISTYFNKKIRLVEKENGGPASARNTGIRTSNGEYILPLDADDKLSSTAIYHLINVASNQDELTVVFGSYQMFGVENKLIISADLFSEEKLKRFDMLHNSSLYSKKVWDLIEGYKEDPALIGYEDWEFWINCLKHKISFCGLREVVIYYRTRNFETTGTKAFAQHHNKFSLIVNYNSELFNPTIVKESENLLLSFGLIKKDNKPDNELEQILSQITDLVNRYQQKRCDRLTIASLRQLRQKFSEKILNLPTEQLICDYCSYLGNAHQNWQNTGFINETLTEQEQNFVNTLSVHISKGFDEPRAIQYLLVAMLYQRADQLPLQPDLTHISQWLLQDYLKYIFKFPCLFQEIGEADNYYRYLYQWLDYLQENISNNPESALWQYIAKFFLQTANFISLYFTTENVKDIYTKRANIIELALKIQGCQIDYDFPERPVERKKIRLGILAAHFQPSTETFHTLPAYKHLDWNNFEIILFTASSNNSRLERYCAGHADALVTLPSDLQSQVQTIRDANLDILLIATNVTAVTNQITLLALHRLARVQVTFGSCPTTTGIRNIDYFISGSLSEPASNAREHYREKLVTLDGVGYCFDYLSELETPTIKPNRENWGATEKTVVFTSGANCYKIIPELRETWAKILAAVPDSILVLYPFSPSWSNSYPATAFLNQMHTVLAKYDVDKTRLIVLDTLPSRADVKEVLKLADVYLDSYRHSGGHSLVDALEVGLPTVVLEGSALRARHGTAYLRQIQILDLITDNEIDYIKLAVELGTNPELRKQKSDRIFQKMQQNPSFLDSRSYSAQMGALFQQLFQKYQADALADQLRLRDVNLVMFPDWHQSEESLYEDFANVLKTMSSNPDKSRMTLLIDTDGIDGEDANWLFSSVAMNLLMEEAVDIADDLEVSLLDDLSENEWELLLSLMQGRISLENENQNAIAKAKAQSLKVYS